MTPEDKKIWEEVAKTIKPLKKEKKEPVRKSSRTGVPSSSGDREEKTSQIRQEVHQPTSLLRPKILHSQDRLITRKLRQGSYRIEATLDLHGQTQEQAYASLQRFLGWAQEQQLKLVLIITGKGRRVHSFSKRTEADLSIGVLRQKLPEWLENTAQFAGIVSVSMARPKDGGTGAWYVELKTV